MARARNIKPSLFKNEVLGVADPLYTLLFEGLWVLADREGRLEDRPLRIKAEVFPYRDGINMEQMLGWLQAQGFIRRYVANGVRCIVILNFAKHQNPHKNESESELPSPDSATEEIGTTSENIGSARADSLNLIPDSLNPQPITPAPVADATTPRRERSRSGDWNEEFAEFWNIYPRRPGDSRANAHKKFIERITKDKATAEQIIAGARRYAAYVVAAGTEPQYVKQAETFLGPGKHYESDWTVPARTVPPDKFHLSGVDRSGDNAVAEASRRKHGIVIDPTQEYEF